MAVHADIGVDDWELPPEEAYEHEGRPHGVNGNGTAGPTVTRPQPFAVRRLDEIETRARSAVVQGLGIDESSVVAIAGAPNAGKTALGVSLALAIASRATEWLGRKVSGGMVVYFAAEAPASVVMRARAAARRAQTNRAPLYISDAAPGLGSEINSQADTDRIIATVRSVESIEGDAVRAVFLDTLAACLGGGDENGEGMLRLADAARRIALETSAAVILIHHPAKGDGAPGLRGHGSLHATCDSVLRVDIEDVTGVRTASLVKARDCAIGAQLRFELEQVVLEERDSFGDPVTTIVVRPTSQQVPRPRPSGSRQQQLLTELERRYRVGEPMWDEATVIKAGRDLGMHRNSPAVALKGLLKAGYLTGSAASIRLKYPPEDVP